jgi:hypothetical protein
MDAFSQAVCIEPHNRLNTIVIVGRDTGVPAIVITRPRTAARISYRLQSLHETG